MPVAPTALIVLDRINVYFLNILRGKSTPSGQIEHYSNVILVLVNEVFLFENANRKTIKTGEQYRHSKE